MAHPYSGHRENAVGHRRVKVLMKSGGYAGGGMSDKAVEGFAKRLAKHERAEIEGRADGGAVSASRLDKRARGGAMKHGPDCTCAACGGKVQKRQRGGAIHQITPSKRKPHTNINIVNVNHRPRPKLGMPMGGPGLPSIGPAMPAPPGAGLPLRARGGKIGTMRKGKDYGQGTGEGRLEEFKHMRNK